MKRLLNAPEGNDLTQWLVEAGRRARLDSTTPVAQPMGQTQIRKEVAPVVRRNVLMGMAALAFLQYYYFYVMVEIGQLPTVIVFVPSPLT